MRSGINDISMNSCTFLSYVNVLCASNDESNETASWSTIFMGSWVENQLKNKLHCVLEFLRNCDRNQKLFGNVKGRFQSDAFHWDISWQAQDADSVPLTVITSSSIEASVSGYIYNLVAPSLSGFREWPGRKTLKQCFRRNIHLVGP